MIARLIRFMTELLGTGTFILVFFGLPLIAMVLGGTVIRQAQVAETGGARQAVYWEEAGGGDGGTEDETVDVSEAEGDESDAHTLPEQVAAAETGKAYRPRGMGTRTPGYRRGSGTGSGEGDGNGPVTMYRPDGHDRPRRVHQGGSGRACEPSTDAIVAVDGRTYQVERALVEEYRSVKAAKTLVGWVAKHEDERGRMNGVQVGGIACGSPLHLAGIRSGDVVHDVNGKEITGILSALSAYKQLKKADVLTVNLTRSGRPLQVIYHLT